MRPKRRPSSRRSPPSAVAATSRLVGDEQQQVPGRRAQHLAGRLRALLPEELRDRGAPLARLLDRRPGDRLAAVALDDLVEPVELRARQRLVARVDRAHDAAGAEHRLEDLEVRSAQRVADVDDLQAEAPVGAVGSPAQHRLVVGQALPRRRGHVEAGQREHLRHEALHDVEDVVLLHEAHLDVELRELRLAVGPRVLVAKAAGDLVVALVAAHHQQLLEELRRLRQRVPGARLAAVGDEEVAGALRRRAREDRRLDLQEVLGRQRLAHRADDGVAQDERVAHALAAQVEHPVAQAQHLVDRRVLVDRERRRLRLRERRDLGDLHLDLAGRDVRVDVLRRAAHDLALRGEDVLGTQPLGGRERLGLVGVEDELDDPGAVAEVDEDEPAVVATAVHPAGDARARSGAAGVQIAGPGVAVRVRPWRLLHQPIPRSRRMRTTTSAAFSSSSVPALRSRRTVAPSGETTAT